MKSLFHDANPNDPCDNPDCVNCHPETWDGDDYSAEPAWWWPWSLALLAAVISVAIVVASGAPRP